MLSRYVCSKYRDQVSRIALGLRRDLPVLEQMPQPNVFAIKMAIALGAGIEKHYSTVSEDTLKSLTKQFTQLVEAGLKTAKKKDSGDYEPVMPEFSSWVLDPEFRYEGTKRMLDFVTSVEMPSIGEAKFENDYAAKDKVVFPDNPSSCIPPAVIAERIIQSLYRVNGTDVQTTFDGYTNGGGAWPYASEDQKDECARLLRAFGFDVKYSKKAKKSAVKLSNSQAQHPFSPEQYWFGVAQYAGVSLSPADLPELRKFLGDESYFAKSGASTPDESEHEWVTDVRKVQKFNIQREQDALHFNDSELSDPIGMTTSDPERDHGTSAQYASKKEATDKSEWISKKIEKLINEGKEKDQASAIAYSMYEQKHGGKKAVKLSSFHKADVNVEINKDLTKPEAPPMEEVGAASGNPDLDENMRNFLSSFLDKAQNEGMPEQAVMEKTGDDPVINPAPNDEILSQDKLGNNVSIADGKTEQATPNDMKIKNYTTTVARVNAYIDLLKASDREQAENMLVAHAQRLSTAAKISPEDAVTRIKANLKDFSENIEILNKSYKDLYEGIPVTAAIVGKPGEKSNRYCNHERCKSTQPHTVLKADQMKCDNCGTLKNVVNKEPAKAQVVPNDYFGLLKVVPMGGKFAIVDTANQQVLSTWPDERSALERINSLYHKLRNRVKAPEPDLVTAQQQQTVLTPEQKTILLNELSQKQSSGNLSPDQKALVDVGIQNLKQDLQTPVNPAQPQQPQNPQQTQPQQPAVPQAGGMQQPTAPVAKAASMLENAVRNGESLTIEQVEEISPLAAKKMRESGMAKVKAEYLMKRVLPYISVE